MGHEVRTIVVADLDFPILRSKQDWDIGQTTGCHCFCARHDPLGTTSFDRASAVDRIHAGIAKAF